MNTPAEFGNNSFLQRPLELIAKGMGGVCVVGMRWWFAMFQSYFIPQTPELLLFIRVVQYGRDYTHVVI